MHELGIAQNIVEIAVPYANGGRIRRVTLEIGQLSAVLPDAIQFCFQIVAQGTPLEGASLQVIQVPGLANCRRCGATIPLEEPFGICSCGSTDLAIIQGNELTIKQLELEEQCA